MVLKCRYTFDENPIETHPVLAGTVKALPTLAHVRALGPPGAHTAHSATGALIDALEIPKGEHERCHSHHSTHRETLATFTCVVSVWHLCVPLKKAISLPEAASSSSSRSRAGGDLSHWFTSSPLISISMLMNSRTLQGKGYISRVYITLRRDKLYACFAILTRGERPAT